MERGEEREGEREGRVGGKRGREGGEREKIYHEET